MDVKFIKFNPSYNFPQSSEDDSGETYVDQMFRIFDKDGDGSIDFKVPGKKLRFEENTFSGIHDWDGYVRCK